MNLDSFSYPFLDWLCREVIEASGGMLSEENVFDERRLDLFSLVSRSIAEGLGYACAISLARVRKEKPDAPDDTMHVLSCDVGIKRNAAICSTDTTPLAENLYARFCGAGFKPFPHSGCSDVWADDFHVLLSDKSMTHAFTVSTRIQI